MSLRSAEVAALIADLTRDGEPDWATIVDLGLTGIGIAEENGGSGGTLVDLATAVTELAARGVHLPLAEIAVARWALAADPERRGAPATVAVAQTATLAGDRLSVVARGVYGVREATHLVVVVRDRPHALVVDLSAPTVRIEESTDLAGRPIARICIEEAAASSLSAAGEQVLTRLAVLRAAASLGAARGAFALTSTHVRTRQQFGKPLVALPSVATSLATMRVGLVQADTAVDAALVNPAPAQAAAARLITARVATAIAEAAHQLHGAIGITAEYALHRYTRPLWAGRDIDLPEAEWARWLGRHAVSAGEDSIWNDLTAPTEEGNAA
ncbi:MAG: acyl-CoA dehydrogenase family protein [Sporichthyaceae bacterium]